MNGLTMKVFLCKKDIIDDPNVVHFSGDWLTPSEVKDQIQDLIFKNMDICTLNAAAIIFLDRKLPMESFYFVKNNEIKRVVDVMNPEYIGILGIRTLFERGRI
jgi:hypothetical protein